MDQNRSHIKPASVPRSDEFWFSDGTVILQTSTKKYRIYKGYLAARSSMFRDMFELPQAQSFSASKDNADENVGHVDTDDGGPIVHVDDSADHWDALLSVMFMTGNELDYNAKHVLPPPTLAALLHLGDKYDFTVYLSIAVKQVKEMILPSPTHNLVGRTRHILGSNIEDYTEGHEFKLVQACVDGGIQSVLPALYLQCVRNRTVDEILRGTDEPDGPVYLSDQKVHTLIAGGTAIKDAARKVAFKSTDMAFNFVGGNWYCVDRDRVHDFEVKRDNTDDLEVLEHHMRPLRSVNHADDISLDTAAMCDHCRIHAERLHQEARLELLEDLPLYFGLPRWAELKDD